MDASYPRHPVPQRHWHVYPRTHPILLGLTEGDKSICVPRVDEGAVDGNSGWTIQPLGGTEGEVLPHGAVLSSGDWGCLLPCCHSVWCRAGGGGALREWAGCREELPLWGYKFSTAAGHRRPPWSDRRHIPRWVVFEFTVNNFMLIFRQWVPLDHYVIEKKSLYQGFAYSLTISVLCVIKWPTGARRIQDQLWT